MSGPALVMATVIVPEMDAAIAHYTGAWGFTLAVDDRHASGHRWIEIATGGARLRLAEARDEGDRAAIGRQAGTRVAFFLESRAFDADLTRLVAGGVTLLEPARRETYGRVAVLADAFGNRWDLIEPVGETK